MDFIINFFKDTLSGWLYFFDVVICLILILAILGVLGDKKKAEIMKELRAQKEKDLIEGTSAKKAALEGKQIIAVEEPQVVAIPGGNAPPVEIAAIAPPDVKADQVEINIEEQPKEETPNVLVLGSEDNK